MDIAELKALKISELTKVAQDLNITGSTGLKKQELIFKILEEQTKQEGLIFAEGVLEILPDGYLSYSKSKRSTMKIRRKPRARYFLII